MTVYSSRDDALIDVVRQTVHQLEVLTRRLQTFIDCPIPDSDVHEESKHD